MRILRLSEVRRIYVIAVATLIVVVPIASSANDAFEFFGLDPEQMTPEARDGLNEIYSGRMFYSAMPLSLVEAMAAAEAKNDLGYDPTTTEGKFFASGALPSPPDRELEPDLSLGQSVFERDGAVLANINCFACHAGIVNGMVVAGLGNNSVMQRPPRPEGSQGPNMFALMGALKTDAEKKAVMDTMARMRESVSPVVPEVTNRGDNYGPFAVWARGAQLADPAHSGFISSPEKTELVALIEENMVPPVDPMPWWLMKYKVRDYWYGDGNPSDAAHFSFNFSGSGEEANLYHADHVASTAKALAFARETQSPPYPGSLNADLVRKGADLFHGRTEPADPTAFKTCAECHGTYSKMPAHPDLSKPGFWNVDYSGSEELKRVRTDKTYNEIVQMFRPISEHINKLKDYYLAKETPELAPVYDHLEGKGYVPPPLVGVWATAPYFHNGSVPTIMAVLNSKERPEIWAREPSPYAYDLNEVGLEFDELSRSEYDARIEKAATAPYKSEESLSQMFIYDTTGYGRGNMGHTFGDTLSDSERAAIVEFLKSLSGPQMTPVSAPETKQAKLE